MLLAGGTALRAAEPVSGSVVRDLYYGETLFQFYQDEHFDALTHLLVARDSGRVSNHEAESELLLGGLYLHYGQHIRAEQIFSRLLQDSSEPEVRNRAWFYLGKVRYQRSLYAEALDAFDRVAGVLPANLDAELPMLKAQAYLALGRFDAAVALLDGWQGPESWVAYARYNLGVALLGLNRSDEAIRQLDRLGRGSAGSAELRDLRDKANLALGYIYLQQGRDSEARPVLARVRLNGPFSAKALLGAGWADAAAQDYRAALTPWLELRDRDLLDSAVQESLLAIPYAWARLDAHSEAAAGYQAALDAYDAEIAKLDVAISGSRSGQLVPAMLSADDARIGRWYWQLEDLPDSVENRYLYDLVARHSFQEGLRNVRDLAALSANLDEWQSKLSAFEEMVNTRRMAHAQREGRVVAGLDRAGIDELQARRDVLAAHLARVAETRETTGLATTEELDHWQRLDALGKSPLLTSAAAGDAAERHRVLKGVLSWNLDRDYKYRLWQQQRNLAELDALLEQAQAAHASGQSARQDTPAELDRFAARIAGLAPRISNMQATLARDRADEEQRLQAMAIGVLNEQRERLLSYRVQAQFALATIYDRAASAARAVPAAERKP
ncbi:MAG: tetratricopeptide repeat protein [Gammaproteobacteria bacterium]